MHAHTTSASCFARLAITAVGVAVCGALLSAQTTRRPLSVDDLGQIKEVRDPQCSPEGRAVAFVVSTTDVKEDKTHSHIWTVGVDGAGERQVTSSQDSESSPKFSPDGKYLSFTSSRPGKAKGNQVWLLERSGGEAFQLTDVKGRLQGYEWSPDSKRLALVVGDPDPDAVDATAGDSAKPKVPKPIVIDRYKYKQDVQGYLLSGRHTYIYLFDIATRKLDRLTASKADEAGPSWSPDGSRIAFMSNHAADPDRDPSSQLFVVDAKAGATERAVTPPTSHGGRGRAEWSPDGKWLAFLEGDDKKYNAYGMEHLTVVPSDGSQPPMRVKGTEDLDRGVAAPHFSADGKSVVVLVTDDRSEYPVRVTLATNRVDRLMTPPVVVSGLTMAGSCEAGLSGGDAKATEVYRVEAADGRLTQISHQNDALFAELDLGTTEEVGFKSKDGTEVHALLTKPVGYVAGTKVPLLLRIHGGPNSQEQHAFSFERQLFAANGYAVLAVNYRGSAGRGQKFSRAIFADWGHYEVDDLEAALDYAIKSGHRRSGPPGRRRLELRRDSHRLHDCHRHALQGGDERRRHGVHRVVLRHRSVHHSVRLRNRPAMGSEGVGDVPEAVVSVPARRSHQDADAVSRRREGLQRAGAGRSADVPGAAQPRHRHAADHLSRTVPRLTRPELHSRPL